MNQRANSSQTLQRTGILRPMRSECSGEAYNAVVLGHSDGQVRVSIGAPLTPRIEVELRLDCGAYFTGPVLYCRQAAAAEYHLGVIAGDCAGKVDRRVEARYPVRARASLTILPSMGSNRQTFARYGVELDNVSRSGVGVVSSEPVDTGTAVQLKLKNSEVFGVVRNCTPFGFGRYRIGIAVSEVLNKERHASRDAMLALFSEQEPPPALAGIANAVDAVTRTAARGLRVLKTLLPGTTLGAGSPGRLALQPAKQQPWIERPEPSECSRSAQGPHDSSI